MKRFALITAFCLAVTGAAVAQQDMGNVKVVGSTYTTGVVESNTTDSMTFREDGGELRTVLFDKGTVGALGHPVGTHVRVNFHTNASDQAIADEIQGLTSDNQVAANAIPEAKVVSEPVLPSGAPIEEPAVVAEAAPAPPVEPARVEPASAEPLPKTASNLFGLGLIGLLSLSSAAIFRAVR